MADELTTQYKDHPISYVEYSNEWVVYVGEVRKPFPTLVKAKEYVDRLVKKTKAFKPVPCYIKSWNDIALASITSIEEGTDRCWTTRVSDRGEKKRALMRYTDIWSITDKSSDAVKEFYQLGVKENEIRRRRSDILENPEFVIDLNALVAQEKPES